MTAETLETKLQDFTQTKSLVFELSQIVKEVHKKQLPDQQKYTELNKSITDLLIKTTARF